MDTDALASQEEGTPRLVGLWCRKGHLIEPGDDQGQCEAVGLVMVLDAECEWTDDGWKIRG